MKKHRIEEEIRAEMFIEKTKAKLGDVYERIADCCDTRKIFAADILYHSNCMRDYLRDEKISNDTVPSFDSSKHEIVEKLLSDIQPALLNGYGFPFSEIRDAINAKIYPEKIRNNQVQSYFMKHYGDSIRLSTSNRKNESLLFFFICNNS